MYEQLIANYKAEVEEQKEKEGTLKSKIQRLKNDVKRLDQAEWDRCINDNEHRYDNYDLG